jgi:hypothetical protein
MQRSYYPICESVNVYSDVLIDLRTPRREIGSIVIEAVYGLFAHCSNEVDGHLEIESLFVHHDRYHIMGVALGLLHVV